jgi:hypothetical protein
MASVELPVQVPVGQLEDAGSGFELGCGPIAQTMRQIASLGNGGEAKTVPAVFAHPEYQAVNWTLETDTGLVTCAS